jgi:hypothetical protein
MLVAAARELVFDGRDVTDIAADRADVRGYLLQSCPHCATLRDARFAFCCELATEPAPARVLTAV